MILLDTNILLRLADGNSADREVASSAVFLLRGQSRVLVIARQSLFEFWAVATRTPGKPPNGSNGLGMIAPRADRWLDQILRMFRLLEDPPDLHERWRVLVRSFNVLGIRSHDVRLVAAMEAHGIKNILTFNGKDFRKFSSIQIIEPSSVQ